MAGTNSMLGMPKPKQNYHICKLFGLQQSGSIADHCERMEEFNEEDVWDSVYDAEAKQIGLQKKDCNVVARCISMAVNKGNSNYSKNPVKIPRRDSCYEENYNKIPMRDSSHEENHNSRRTRHQSSAPVNIPDWSQMGWKEKRNENYRTRVVDHDCSHDDEDDGSRDFERIPPHELIARQLAQNEITSSSVYEGVGRTLKGRDLSRVRNAVLTRTGFIE